ncbi:MAG: hypothetical protein HRF49_11140 [bacterium]|jgi:TolB-like protein
MKKALFLIFALSLVLLANSRPGTAQSGQSGKLRVGVMQFENIAGATAFDWVGRGIQESLSSKLAALPQITVVERGQMNKLLEEQRFQMSGFTDTSTVAEAGKIMNIQKAVVGSYQVQQSKILISARVVDVESAQAENSTEVNGNVDDIFSQYNTLASDIGRKLGAGESVNTATSGAATSPAPDNPPPSNNFAQDVQDYTQYIQQTQENPQSYDELTNNQVYEFTREDTTSFEAYEYFTRANDVLFGSDSVFTFLLTYMDDPNAVYVDPSREQEGARLLELAVKADPNYGRAWALLGMTYHGFSSSASGPDRRYYVQKANEALEHAVNISTYDPYVQSLMGFFNFLLWTEYNFDPAYSDAAYQWLDLVLNGSPGTYYSGIANLVVIFLLMNVDENFMMENSASLFYVMDDARNTLPTSGVVQAFHGMFLALDAMVRYNNGYQYGTLTQDDVYYVASDMDYAIAELEDYVNNFPNGLVYNEVYSMLGTLYEFRNSI